LGIVPLDGLLKLVVEVLVVSRETTEDVALTNGPIIKGLAVAILGGDVDGGLGAVLGATGDPRGTGILLVSHVWKI